MKDTITRILFTTCAAVILLAVYFLITGEKYFLVITIFHIFIVNIIINIGIYFRSKFEIQKFILEFFVDVSFIIVVLLIFGYVLNWYPAVPVWYIALMAAIIYIIAAVTTVVKIKKNTKEINELLEKRKEKDSGFVS